MKFITLLALALFAFSSFSADDLSSAKKKKTDSIDKQMSALKSYRTCVVGATSNEIVESCRYEGPQEAMQEEEAIIIEPNKEKNKKSGY